MAFVAAAPRSPLVGPLRTLAHTSDRSRRGLMAALQGAHTDHADGNTRNGSEGEPRRPQ